MREPTAEEKAAGTDDPAAQGEAILAESEERTVDRDDTPDGELERRRSDDATPPP